jgi:hypothetical protein
VIDIRTRRLVLRQSTKLLAREFGLNTAYLREVISGRSWSHVKLTKDQLVGRDEVLSRYGRKKAVTA